MSQPTFDHDTPHHLSADDAFKLLMATSFLNEAYGVTFNSFLTITYAKLGIRCGYAASKFLTDLNNWISRYINRHAPQHRIGDDFWQHAYVYVHENARDQGLHTHQLMWIPPRLRHEFNAQLARWVDKWGRRHCYRIPKSATLNKIRDYRHEYARVNFQWYRVRYILKNIALQYIETADGRLVYLPSYLGINRIRASGPIDCAQKCGTSHNIGPQMQGRALFEFDQPDLETNRYTGWELEAFRWRQERERPRASYPALRSFDF